MTEFERFLAQYPCDLSRTPRLAGTARGRRGWWLVLVSVCVALAATACLAGEPQALVGVLTPLGDGRQGMCSGVCIDPRGLVATAKHCRCGAATRVHFADGEYSCTVAYQPAGGEGVTLLRVQADRPLPHVAVAAAAPRPGEAVYSLGFPAGNFSRNEGRVRRIVRAADGLRIETDFRIFEGNSGGPLFNAAGELVGIASTRSLLPDERGAPPGSRPAAYWMHTDAIHQAVAAATAGAPDAPPQLWVFSADLCGPCGAFAQDYARNAAGLRSALAAQCARARDGRHYGEVKRAGPGWSIPAIAAECERATGRRITAVPTFWVRGRRDVLTGYPGPASVLRYVAEQAGAGPSASGPDDAAPFHRPPPREGETPESYQREPETEPPEPDWSAVTIIVLAARDDAVGEARGALRAGLLAQFAGPLERIVAEQTGGRARLSLVPQRTQPERYAAVVQAARIAPGAFYVLVLVRETETGWIKGKLVEAVEGMLGRAADKKLTSSPVDVIFERLHPEDHRNVETALAVDVGGHATEQDAPWWYGLFAGLVGFFRRWIQSWRDE